MSELAPDFAARARACADEAAYLLESVGDLAAVRTLRYLLATGSTDPVMLARTARELLGRHASAVLPAVPPAEDLRSQAGRAFHAINGRLAREFDARLADVRIQAEQQLVAGIGEIAEALARFNTGIAQLAYDLETRLWAEIGWLAAGLAHDVDEYALAQLSARLPTPLRRVPVTLRAVVEEGPPLTAGDALDGLAKSARLIHGLGLLSGATIDPSGVLPLAAALTAVAARRRRTLQRQAARDAALAQVAEAAERARAYILDPVYRAATQAQIVLLDQAITALGSAPYDAARPPARAVSPMASALERATALELESGGDP